MSWAIARSLPCAVVAGSPNVTPPHALCISSAATTCDKPICLLVWKHKAARCSAACVYYLTSRRALCMCYLCRGRVLLACSLVGPHLLRCILPLAFARAWSVACFASIVVPPSCFRAACPFGVPSAVPVMADARGSARPACGGSMSQHARACAVHTLNAFPLCHAVAGVLRSGAIRSSVRSHRLAPSFRQCARVCQLMRSCGLSNAIRSALEQQRRTPSLCLPFRRAQHAVPC